MKKRLFATLLTLLLSVSIIACGDAPEEPETTETVEETTENDSESETKKEVKKETKKKTKKKSSKKKSQKKTSTNGIRPEFKEALDSYEDFFDEYIAFMKKYTDADSTEALEMMGDYTDYMEQYAITMEKLDELETDDLSKEETLYYVKVTNRITEKLLEVAY